jgi:hypothetical protein
MSVFRCSLSFEVIVAPYMPVISKKSNRVALLDRLCLQAYEFLKTLNLFADIAP